MLNPYSLSRTMPQSIQRNGDLARTWDMGIKHFPCTGGASVWKGLLVTSALTVIKSTGITPIGSYSKYLTAGQLNGKYVICRVVNVILRLFSSVSLSLAGFLSGHLRSY